MPHVFYANYSEDELKKVHVSFDGKKYRRVQIKAICILLLR